MKNHRINRFLPATLLPFLLVFNSAFADITHYAAGLSGGAEDPPNASTGTGQADVYFDDVAMTLRIVVSFSNLLGTVTAAHIHAATAVANAGTAAVATQTPSFVGFPSGVTSGFYDQTFDLMLDSTYRAGYLTANGGTASSAAAALVAALDAEKAYLNVHTTAVASGEIRGFLHDVPERGSTALLLVLAMASITGIARGRKFRA
ncbi:MAG TPA: CHRD domain-containing protein [Lacunisphaera sp.]|nr:CHRD domain-containing protein [Lacunisphaera sp.]